MEPGICSAHPSTSRCSATFGRIPLVPCVSPTDAVNERTNLAGPNVISFTFLLPDASLRTLVPSAASPRNGTKHNGSATCALTGELLTGESLTGELLTGESPSHRLVCTRHAPAAVRLRPLLSLTCFRILPCCRPQLVGEAIRRHSTINTAAKPRRLGRTQQGRPSRRRSGQRRSAHYLDTVHAYTLPTLRIIDRP